MNKPYAEVIFPLPVNQAFTYHIPADLQQTARVGCRVLAPFGTRRLTGFIVALKDSSDFPETKDILDVLDVEPLFSADTLKLATWISDYYICSLGEALKAAVPAVFLMSSKMMVSVRIPNVEEAAEKIQTSAPRQAQILRFLSRSGRLSLNALKRKIGSKHLYSSVSQLAEHGLVTTDQHLGDARVRPKLQKWVRLLSNGLHQDRLDTLRKTAPKQAQCLNYLLENGPEINQKDMMQATGISSSSLKSLKKNQLVELFDKEVIREYYDSEITPPPPLELNPEQEQAYRRVKEVVEAEGYETFLLYGVTGSGKTQVYIDAIHHVLQKGKDAIVLVPEIALTPQTVHRFRSHFREQVQVLHSAMSDGERYDAWRKIKKGQARVVIGPRSAVFAPLKNIGLIVVDEEHETSYKQTDTAPRYHARDVAIMRAKFLNAAVILGSATPSVDSFYNAQIGKFQLLELTRRIDNVPMPEVRILDMAKERRLADKKTDLIFSRALTQKITEKLQNQEQVILLLNRRGFSNFIKCRDCGFIEECENCNITLTYHLRGHVLRCHYCNFTKRAPDVCPKCHCPDIVFKGIGTQRVEEALKLTIPQARVVRMDLDTTSQKHAHDRILRDFDRGKYDILLGTQMIAKGLDFHKVTLVGVINADLGLLIPDFRSFERTFQLLTQVAGRAGRKHLPGEVIIQTYSTNSRCLLCAQDHDFKKFFYGEIAERRELNYPPFGRLVSLLFRGKDEAKVTNAAKTYAEIMKSLSGPFQVLGPTPSPLVRIQNKYRWQLVLKGDRKVDPGGKRLRDAIHKSAALFKERFRKRGVQISIDVDPQMLV